MLQSLLFTQWAYTPIEMEYIRHNANIQGPYGRLTEMWDICREDARAAFCELLSNNCHNTEVLLAFSVINSAINRLPRKNMLILLSFTKSLWAMELHSLKILFWTCFSVKDVSVMWNVSLAELFQEVFDQVNPSILSVINSSLATSIYQVSSKQ